MVRDSFDAIYECGVPVIAAVGAPAIGAGLALAACCDLIVASTKATFALTEIDEARIANREKRLPDFRWE